MSKIQENLKKILETIPENVKLVAVSKFHPAEEVIEAIKAGQNLFGENRVKKQLKNSMKSETQVFLLNFT